LTQEENDPFPIRSGHNNPLITEIIGLKERVARLEERTSSIEKFMGTLQNRLTSLEKRLEKIDGRVWAILSGIVVTIVLQIALSFM